jgi:predicted  nucleic acid-binding Zn-ribbon protein
VRSETQTQDYQENLKKVDSLNSELKYQIVDLEAELEKLIKAKSMKQEKSDKKSKRKKKKKEELPEFIIEE